MKLPNLVFVDSGYGDYAEEIYQFVHESGQSKGQYFATKGQGTMPDEPKWKEPQEKDTITLGHEWYVSDLRDGDKYGESTFLVFFHTDYWKQDMHDRWRAAEQAPGSLYMYNESRHHHFDFVNHHLAEKKRTVILKGIQGGIKTVWEHEGGRPNHYGDCTYMCLAAADMMGVKVMTIMPVQKKKQKGPREQQGSRKAQRRRRGSSINTKY